jgi:hypothetical protein
MIGNMLVALLLAAATPDASPPPGTWQVESGESACLATGWLRGGSSVSMIFARQARTGSAPAEREALPEIWIDGRRIGGTGAVTAIVAYDSPRFREETEADRDSLATLLSTAATLQMRRPGGRTIATIPLVGAHRIAAALARCLAEAAH